MPPRPESLDQIDGAIAQIVFEAQRRAIGDRELTVDEIETLNASSANDLAALREMLKNMT